MYNNIPLCRGCWNVKLIDQIVCKQSSRFVALHSKFSLEIFKGMPVKISDKKLNYLSSLMGIFFEEFFHQRTFNTMHKSKLIFSPY